ncbi:hypothetical protein CLE01_34140 [Cryobacterium levicorallinum]|nr:hypothetical protein CLE01_34140 [Cryobacterium levicorallinum]
MSGLVTHELRKTAATVTSEDKGSQTAADLPGHASDTLTKESYISCPKSVTGARDALATLFKAGQ